MSKTFVPIAARPAPIKMEGVGPWLRNNLFSSIGNTVISLVVLALLAWAASGIAQWGIFHAVTAADPDACQAARGVGACWGVIREKAASSCWAATRSPNTGAPNSPPCCCWAWWWPAAYAGSGSPGWRCCGSRCWRPSSR